MEDQRIFTCLTHNFTTVARADGEVSCRGSEGHRDPDCDDCTAVVNDAFDWAEENAA